MSRARYLVGICGVAGLAFTAAPTVQAGEVPGVAALNQQGHYWQAKGRQDLANQAFRRALALDPANAEAQRGLAGPAPSPPPPPARVAARVAARPAAVRPSAAAPAPRPKPDTGAARAAGFRTLGEGDLDLAAKQFERSIAANPQDADSLGGLGIVRLKQSRFAEARDLLNRATRSGDGGKWAEALASARFFAGIADVRNALSHGQLTEAQTGAEALVRSGYADTGPALELLAEIYERQGRYADAADIYRQATNGNQPGSTRLQSRAARDRALQAAANGDEAGAEQAFQSGLILDPSDPWIRYEFARFLTAHGRGSEADALISSMAMSQDADWLYAAALLTAAEGRPAAADALIGRIDENQRTVQMRNFAIGLKTDMAIARAREMAQQGHQTEAAAALRQLSATPGIDAAKQATIADALYGMGDADGAATLAQKALGGDIRDPAAYEPIVRVLAETGHDAQATAAFETASQRSGSTAEGQRVIARMNGSIAAARADSLRLAGQYAPAFDILQAAWNTAPGNAQVLAALARLYQSGKMNPQAAQTFQLVIKQGQQDGTPPDKGAYAGLIETAGAAGDTALAHGTIEQALRLFPDDYEIYLAAARMEQARGNGGAAIKYFKRAREIYASKLAGGRLSSGNPFAAGPLGTNPFRQQAMAPAPQPVINPFALGSGARIPGASAMMAPSPSGFGSYSTAEQAPAGTAAFTSTALPATAPSSAPGPYSGDPVLAKIQSDIQALNHDSGPRAEPQTGFRVRTGETGLSALKELTGTAELSTGVGGSRLALRAGAVVLDSGRPTGSALARFGTNATAEAQGIVAAKPSLLTQAVTQHAAGVAVSASFAGPLVQAEVGTTPLGFEKTRITWHGAISPRFSANASGRAWFERKPVTDSVLAYAGTRDPVTGTFWGQVMRTGGGMSVSYDRDGTGVYSDGSYSRYAGSNVPNNSGYQMNVGGYTRFLGDARSSLTGGINFNYQHYANNQNFFTFGHGGYFSPQSFFSVSVPVRYNLKSDRLEIHAEVAPGYQSYNQDQVALYPTNPAAQATLDSLKAQDTDVRSFYDGISQTGFAIAANGSVYYRVQPGTRIGAEFGVNTFGNYNEFKSLIVVRQTLNGDK
jgi:tetratricopeptide (TPR) repeat protein